MPPERAPTAGPRTKTSARSPQVEVTPGLEPASLSTAALQRSLADMSYDEQLAAVKPPLPMSPPVQLQEADEEVPVATGYVGMNVGAEKELAALKKSMKRLKGQTVVSVIDDPNLEGASGVELVEAFKESGLDIYNPDEVDTYFLLTLGVGIPETHPRFSDMVDWLKRQGDATDSMAGLLKMFWDGEQGVYKLERMIFSGHSGGSMIWGEQESSGALNVYDDIEVVADFCPKAAASVEDVMFSACWSFSQDRIDYLLGVFPNLQTVWGYVGFSPSAKSGGSLEHIINWERRTRGHDPTKVKRKGSSVAVWTRDFPGEEGEPIGTVQYPRFPPIETLRNQVASDIGDMEAYLWGDQEPSDNATLRDFYGGCQLMLIHPDLPASERPTWERFAGTTLRLRKWDHVRENFVKHHTTLIEAASQYHDDPAARAAEWKTFFGQVERGVLEQTVSSLEHLKTIVLSGEREVSDTLDKDLWAADLGSLLGEIEHGLWELDPAHIPEAWC